MGNTARNAQSDTDWLAETFRRNRERFAGWRMEADPAPADPAPSDPPADPGKTDPPADPANDPAKGGKDAILGDLAKERDKRQALETTVSEMQAAHKQQMDALAIAFGLKTGDEPPDPAKLAEQITASQAETAAEKTRADDAGKKLAVFLAAPDHEANAVALLDSTSFLTSIKDIDYTDAEKLGDAIKQAVEKDGRFKVAAGTPPFPGGPRSSAPTRAGSLGEAINNKLATTRP